MWAVGIGQVVESSLGYFINPLVSVVLGVVFLHERLRPTQWLPVGLAAAGVLYLTFSYGSLPWIGLVLAFTFGLYGLLKKLAPLPSLPGLTFETGLIFFPALVYLLVMELLGKGSFGHTSISISLLLTLSGIVTAIPLLFFATGARSVPLSTLGLLQYIAPTLQFLIGVLVFHEPFTLERFVGFAFIWTALIIFSVETYLHLRRENGAITLRDRSRYSR